MRPINTVRELLDHVKDSYANPTALCTSIDGIWQTYATAELLDEVKYLALALHSRGLKSGDRIGIIATPSGRWTIADLAIMAAGGITVPLFANISEENFSFIIKQTELKTAFLGGPIAWRRHLQNAALVRDPIGLESTDAEQPGMSYRDMISLGYKVDSEQPDLFRELLERHTPDSLVTIIYTSGSTGTPKGAEHTHSSLLSLVHNDLYNWNWKSDTYLSVLPLAHVYARVLNLILLAWGISIYYFNDLKNLGVGCREVRPTIMVVVPRLLEKMYSKMWSNVQQAKGIKRKLGEWGFALAHQEHSSVWKRLLHPLFDRLVYSRLREALGGRLRVVLSGGAALDPRLNHFLIDAGFPIYEGWGLTEACPITVNRIDATKVGSIGLPIDNLQVKTDPLGELLVRGGNVMRAYYKDPKSTAQALDVDGWLHTGDRGTIDTDGFVFLVGRIKELFKTSTGELVAPIPIEHALASAPYIDTAMIIADKRKFVSCLLVPNLEAIQRLKADSNNQQLTDEQFLDSAVVKKETQKFIDELNTHLNHWEQIRAFRFIPHELSIDRGELTPSVKIVRNVIETRYKDLIDAMYAEGSQ